MESAKWRIAVRPNYDVNTDLNYPYSELPYVGEYHLVRIPTDNQLVEHVDYWGEGRIETSSGNSGFRNCYNVNRQYQLVSNGTDRNKKIPNRIPVFDENMCDTSSYIKSNSVKLVTLMGAPIIERCARDIARIVNSEVGIVVVFGFDNDSADIRRLSTALSDLNMYYCPGYELSDHLLGLTLFDKYRAYVNAKEMENQLYEAVTGWSFDTAVKISQSLKESGGGSTIVDVVNKLLQQGIRATTPFAYKLWNSGEKEIVNNYFPDAFKLIFNGDNIKIVSNYYNMALKLDANVDYYNDRLGWGDKSDHSSNRVSWTLLPIWENNNVIFKIRNNEHSMFLKLDVNVDSYGDRKCWGSNSSNELRHTWKLEPVKLQGNVVFFIVNCEYDQALKLDANVDSYGDRLLWGNNGNVVNNPRYFGWLVQSW
ncbi:microvitellogenin-like [Manduca sexta]|uniref:Uncharacterized protein n=1 Tax=Manduca sexta TaxID=7130 RepID=A0A922CXJ8_MANSE|nr:microvitellogenin-like [Manduca sexta]KAG6463355.1 hypothetical protein O3G_MSEX013816 [Manduca sexta]KAG6463356.1 hypothetical protein O3G_MSEX013816 [Manduca sexta]